MHNDENNSYSGKINYYISRLPSTHRFVEITKCCGYSEMHPILKQSSLTDLYKDVRRIFECHAKCDLYIKHTDMEMSDINCRCDDNFVLTKIEPNDTANSFVQLMHTRNIQPIYMLPSPVVYRIYLDDGHRHDDHKCMFD